MAVPEATARMFWLMLIFLFSSGTAQHQSILTSPSDVTGKVGGTAKFMCKVQFNGIPVMAWEFNQSTVYSLQYDEEDYPKGNTKYSVIREGQNFTLIVTNLQDSDGGTYTCRVLDEVAQANLFVKEAAEDRSILVPPKDATGKLGGIAKFKCVVEFKSIPIMTWEFRQNIIYSLSFEHEDYPLSETKYSVAQDGRTFTLTIYDIRLSDSGTYTCRVLNEAEAANLTVIEAQDPSILNPPNDVIGKLGGTAEFKCEVEFAPIRVMEWEFNQDTIYNLEFDHESFPRGSFKYSVAENGRIFTLTVKDLQYSDAGKYGCRVLQQVEEAHLIVADVQHRPSTSIPIEGSKAEHTCIARFSVPKNKEEILPKHYPQLKMFFDGKILNGTIKEENAEGATTIYYRLIQIHNVTLKISMHRKVLMCAIATSSPGILENVTTDILVHYSVRNVDYTPKSNQHKNGTEIICTADGYPEPHFQWADANNKVAENLTTGPSLTISEQMIKSNTWRCTAMNTVNGQLHQKSVIAVFDVVFPERSLAHSLESENDSWKIAVGVAVPVCSALVVGIAAFYFCFYKRHKKQSGTSNNATYASVPKGECSLADEKNEVETTDSLEKITEDIQDLDETVTLRQSQIERTLSRRSQMGDVSTRQSQSETATPTQSQKELADRYAKLINTIDDIEYEEHLTNATQERVLKLLPPPRMTFPVEVKPSALIKWITKAKDLIGSDHFFSITEKLVKIYLKNQDQMQEDPLSSLVTEMEEQPTLTQNQARLLKLLKILVLLDSSNESRSRCMKALLTKTTEWGKCMGEEIPNEKVPNYTEPLEWDVEFIEVLKLLLQKGVDPTWLPKGSPEGDILHAFIMMGLDITATKAHLSDQLPEIFGLVDSLFARSKHGGISHEVVRIFFSNSKEVKDRLLKFSKHLKSQLNLGITDYQENTALHLLTLNAKNCSHEPEMFLSAVKCLESVRINNIPNINGSTALSIFTEFANDWVDHPKTFLQVVECLQSPENINFRDSQGRTALELFSESGEKWKDCSEAFLRVFECLMSLRSIILKKEDGTTVLDTFNVWASDLAYQPDALLQIAKILIDTDNKDQQDKDDNTMLHKYTFCAKECASQPEAFLRVVACLKSPKNIDVINASGDTPLHIFISKAAGWEDNSDTFLEVVECLKSPTNIDFKDNQGNTALHIFTSSQGRWEDNPSGFLKILKCLVSPENINMQNKKGEVALHHFARYKSEWANLAETPEIIKCLMSPQNIVMTNNRGKNAVELFKSNWRELADPLFPTASDLDGPD